MWPEQSKEDRDRVCDEALARFAAEEDEARKNRMVIVRHSKRHFKVFALAGTRVVGGVRVRQAELVFGPASEEKCGEFAKAAIAAKEKPDA